MRKVSLAQIFQKKLIQWILVPGMLMAVVIVSILGLNQVTVQEREMVQLSRSLVKNVVFYMDGAEDVLQSIALASGGVNIERNLYFNMLHEKHRRFERLMLLDRNENIIAVAPEGIKGVDFPIRINDPQRKGYVLTSPIISPQSGKLVVYISISVEGGGRLVAELSLDALQSFIHGFLSPDRVIMLTDAYGNLIVHPDMELVRTQANLGGLAILSEEGETGKARFYTTGDGFFFGVMSQIPGTGWKLVVASSATFFFRPVIALGILVTFLILIIFLVLLIALKKEFRANVILPLSSYIKKLSSVAKGDYPTEKSEHVEFMELDEFGKVFDVMSRKVREREYDLLVSKTFFQSVIDSMPSALIWVDDDLMVRQCNEKAMSIFNLESTEIRPVGVVQFFSGQSEIAQGVERAVREKIPHTMERRRFPGGGKDIYDITVFPLIGSESKGVVVRIDNVTARVRMEETMVQTEKMISVGGLAAGMAHEINNPIGGILQGAQNLERKFLPDIKANHVACEKAGCSMESLRSYYELRKIGSIVKGIKESGARAAGIVSNMLDFSRPGKDKIEEVNLTDLLEASLSLAAKDYDLKKKYDFLHIRIVRDYDKGLPGVVCSRTEIEQVLFNLFKNSAQAIREHGHSGAHPELRVRTRRRGDNALIEVEDNGPGIKPEIRRRIFEPFFTTKPSGIGTGLGLSVSYFIITQNHGGSFSVEPAPDGGARFVILLPLKKESLEFNA